MDLSQKIQQKIAYVYSLEARQRHAMPIPQHRLRQGEGAAWIALTSVDWALLTPAQVESLGQDICGIVALDDQTVVMAKECGLPWMLWEDLMDFDHFTEAHYTPLCSLRQWSKPFEANYTDGHGIVWPIVDSTALEDFWRDVAFMQAFSQRLEERNMRLIVVTHEKFVPSYYYYSRDTFARLCLAGGGDRVRALTVISSPVFKFSNDNNYLIDSQSIDLEGKVVCALHAGEFFRGKHIIHWLNARYKGRFVLAALTPNAQAQFEGIPVVSLVPRMRDYDAAPFLDAWAKLRARQDIFPKQFSAIILKNLYWYHATRWPYLHHWVSSLIRLFHAHRPTCVLGTTLMDCEAQLAIIAANTLQIPTVAWGHSYAFAYEGWHRFAARKVLIPTRIGMLDAHVCGVPDGAMIPIHDIELKKAYPQKPQDQCFSGAKSFQVAVLLAGTRIKGSCTLLRSMQIEIQGIADLLTPPEDLASEIEVRIKGHPWLHDKAPYVVNGIEESQHAIPVTVDLESVLAQCDCCILFNYVGCGFVFAAAQVPTIFFCNDSILNARSTCMETLTAIYPHVSLDIAGVWDFIRHLIRYPDKRRDLVALQKKTLCEHTDKAVDWECVIEQECRLSSSLAPSTEA